MANLFYKHNFYLPFSEEDKDFSIKNVGYHDFTKIEGYKQSRKFSDFSLHFVLNGKGYYTINRKTYKLKSGDFFLIPRDVEMSYYPDESEPWSYFWFNFDGEKAADYVSEMGFSNYNPVIKDARSVKFSTFIGILNDLDGLNSNKYYLVLSVFYKIMFSLSNNSYNQTALDAKRIIDSNFSNPDFDIDNLCESIGISHSHLCKLFKEGYNITIKKYIINKRLQLAKNLLVDSEFNIKTIAYTCGYKDEIHFVKVFKKEFLSTPKEFRRENKKHPI